MSRTFSQLFFVRRTKKNESFGNVFLRITVNGKRVEISLRREIKLERWSSAQGIAIGNTREIKELNKYLETIRVRVFEIHRSFVVNDVDFTAEMIRDKLAGTEKRPSYNLLEIFQSHNDKFEALTGIEYSFQTLKKFKKCKESLSDFIRVHYNRTDIPIHQLNYEFVKEFEFYLKTEQKCAHNTVMGYVKKLKKIVRHCVAMNWLEKDPFLLFKVTIKEVHRVVLTQEELDKLAYREIGIDRLDRVRDVFLFCCYTGLSFVDVEKLKTVDIVVGIDGENWITINRTKTNTSSRIPLLPLAKDILKKYSTDKECLALNRVLPVASNQKMNGYLKEVTTICGINKELTFHCARHTFATTITLTNGVPIETVSKMLGHKSLKTTQLYGKIVDKKVSDDMNLLRCKIRNNAVKKQTKSDGVNSRLG